jgi:hypothetical protein
MENKSFIHVDESIVDNLKKQLDLKTINFYNPIYINYEVDDSDPYLTLKSKYRLHYILNSSNNIDTNDSNPYIKTFIKAETFNLHTKKMTQRDLFVKFPPLIDPLFELINIKKKDSEPLLPNIHIYERVNKINNFQNSAYIDFYFTYLGSKLTETGKCPSFPIYFGSFSCIKKNFLYDLSEDYSQVKYNRNYQKNIKNKNFNLIVKEVESEDDDTQQEHIPNPDNFEEISIDIPELNIEENIDFDKENENIKSPCKFEETTIDEIEEIDDENCNFEGIFKEEDENIKYIHFDEMPTQCIIIEKLQYTMEELFKDETITQIEWKSIFFQICFALAVAQKKYSFVHNDLHCDNIMFQKTTEEYLYYEFENILFKIPTFGKVVKIIDFGRATFIHNNIIYFSDSFDENGDAEGQYDYPQNNSFKGCKLKPNFSFDLARLSSTIINHFEHDNEIYKLLKVWITDKYGNFLYNEPDDFDLYKNIAKNVNSAVPKKQIKKSFFKLFIENKKNVPSNTFIFHY